MSTTTLQKLEESTINFNQVEEQSFSYYLQDLQQYITQCEEFRKTDLSQFEIKLRTKYLFNKIQHKWQKELGYTANEIDGHIKTLQTPQTEFKSSMSLREVLTYGQSVENKWLVPNLLRKAGLYILAGAPKAGKSLLMYFLMHSIATGASFLDRPIKPGKVLYIQLEEPLDTISERFQLTGFGDVENIDSSLVVNFTDHIYLEREFDITTDLMWLRSRIAEYKPDIVIIDSLRMATLSSPASENTNEFGKLVYALQRIFISTDTCGLVIHHMNKSGGKNQKKTSLIESLAGHTSISAATSGILGITAEQTEVGNKITLRTLPRDGSPLTLDYQIQNTDSGTLELKKIWEDTPISNVSTSKILRFLAQNLDMRYSAYELATQLNSGTFDKEFKDALSFLQSSQMIRTEHKNKKLFYYLDDETVWVAQPKTVKDTVSGTILDANSMLSCKTKRELINLTKDWKYERKHLAASALLKDEALRLKELGNSFEFSEGEVVLYQGEVHTVIELGDKASILKTYYRLNDIEDWVLETDLMPYVPLENIEQEQEIEEEDIQVFDDDLEEDD